MAFHMIIHNYKKNEKKKRITTPLHPDNCHSPSCFHLSADWEVNKVKLKLLAGIHVFAMTTRI